MGDNIAAVNISKRAYRDKIEQLRPLATCGQSGRLDALHRDANARSQVPTPRGLGARRPDPRHPVRSRSVPSVGHPTCPAPTSTFFLSGGWPCSWRFHHAWLWQQKAYAPIFGRSCGGPEFEGNSDGKRKVSLRRCRIAWICALLALSSHYWRIRYFDSNAAGGCGGTRRFHWFTS